LYTPECRTWYSSFEEDMTTIPMPLPNPWRMQNAVSLSLYYYLFFMSSTFFYWSSLIWIVKHPIFAFD
jgi:hypothetical protein